MSPLGSLRGWTSDCAFFPFLLWKFLRIEFETYTKAYCSQIYKNLCTILKERFDGSSIVDGICKRNSNL
jgi:hypothetical protein